MPAIDDPWSTDSGMRHRTVWLSDIHLGSRSCQASQLLRFLEQIECETLYLVGDVIDVIALKRSVYWPESHTLVIRRILELQRAGTKVIYIPGNHDDPFRAFIDSSLAGVPVCRNVVHTTASGKRLLVLHGDEMDAELHCSSGLKPLGRYGYVLLMALHRNVSRLRALLGLPYWSLAAEVKRRVGGAMTYMRRYEAGMIALARRAGVDGVVCGHIHHATLKTIEGTLYCNDGDWVESCSCLVEYANGQLEILRWANMEKVTFTRDVTTIKQQAA